VVSKNLPRRHLNETQRAMVAAKIATARQGRPAAAGDKAPAPTQKQAAAKMKVSEATVKIAKAVKKKGSAELVKAVEQGEVSLNAAAELAKLPKEKQDEVVKAGPAEAKKVAAELRDKPATTRPMPHETKTPRNKPPAAGLGGEKFSFNLIDQAFGALARAVDRMATAYDAKGGTSHTTALDNLEAVIKHLKSWHNRQQKKEGS
jgi:hypothetical protein